MNEQDKRKRNREYMRQYRKRKPEKVLEAREKARESRKEYMKRYREENPEKVEESRAKYYAKFLQARGYTVIAPQEGEAK